VRPWVVGTPLLFSRLQRLPGDLGSCLPASGHRPRNLRGHTIVTTYPPEVQKTLDRAVAAKQAHESALFEIPGVNGISVELKTIKGVRTPEFAIVVHVEHKMPLESLRPGEVIPSSLDGVSTDVIEVARAVLAAGGPADQDADHYATLVGGVAILSQVNESVDPNQSHSGSTQLIAGSGTMGCIAINSSATDPSKKAVALSNAHVLFKQPAVSVKQTAAAVGQTERCSSCCKSLDHTIGHVDHDGVYNGYDASAPPASPPNGVDAAFVTLDPGVQWSAAVIASGEGGSITTEPVAGAYSVAATDALFNTTTTPPTPIYAVHKRGSRTRFTSGWLLRGHFVARDDRNQLFAAGRKGGGDQFSRTIGTNMRGSDSSTLGDSDVGRNPAPCSGELISNRVRRLLFAGRRQIFRRYGSRTFANLIQCFLAVKT
jgi:hypothetical protein